MDAAAAVTFVVPRGRFAGHDAYLQWATRRESNAGGDRVDVCYAVVVALDRRYIDTMTSGSVETVYCADTFFARDLPAEVVERAT